MKHLLILIISVVRISFLGQTAEEYFNRGYSKAELGNTKGAM
ncbi:MAG: hypothetical protein ACYDEC_16870 [Bacteroidia bacterium]